MTTPEQIAKRYGDVEVFASGDHAAFADVVLADDSELFSDCIAIDYCIFHFRNSEKTAYDARLLVSLLLIIVNLMDAISISTIINGEDEIQRELLFSRSRADYLLALMREGGPWLRMDEEKRRFSTMRMNFDLMMLTLVWAQHMFGIVSALKAKALDRRKAGLFRSASVVAGLRPDDDLAKRQRLKSGSRPAHAAPR